MIHHGTLTDIEFKTILLDFDGVVADTEAVFAHFDCKLINNILTQANLSPDQTPEHIRALAGMSGDKKLEHVAKDKSFDPERYISSFLEQRNVERKTLFKDQPPTLAPGLIDLLEKYQGRYALATNKERHKIEIDLACMELQDYFKECLFCLEKELAAKPAPDILLAAMQETNMKPEETLYIGDNAIDMQAALAAGTTAVGFIFGDLINFEDRKTRLLQSGAQIIIDDLSDVI